MARAGRRPGHGLAGSLHRVNGGHDRGGIAVRDSPRRAAGVVSAEQFEEPGGGRHGFARLEGIADAQIQHRQVAAVDLPGAEVDRMAGGDQPPRCINHAGAVQHLPRGVVVQGHRLEAAFLPRDRNQHRGVHARGTVQRYRQRDGDARAPS